MKRLYLFSICVLLLASAQAQTKRKRPSGYNKAANENEQFLKKQWWLGFKAGTNLSKAVVDKAYSVISPVNATEEDVHKKYKSFNKLGTQATLEITFSYKQFSVSVQPTYRHARYVYSNEYHWAGDTVQTHDVTLNYVQEQKVDHAEIPLIFKYEVGQRALRPYFQIGAYSAFLINANKSVTVSGTDNASGSKKDFQDPAIIVGAKDLFAKNSWGLIGGAGINYHVGNIRFNLDVMYKKGMSNITSTKNRYSNDRVSGIGDALDDVKLNNLSISLGCLFPLRFLGSGFKSIDK